MIYLTKDKGYVKFKIFFTIYLYIFTCYENCCPLIRNIYFKYPVINEADETIYILHNNTDIQNLESGNIDPVNTKYLPEKKGAQ